MKMKLYLSKRNKVDISDNNQVVFSRVNFFVRGWFQSFFIWKQRKEALNWYATKNYLKSRISGYPLGVPDNHLKAGGNSLLSISEITHNFSEMEEREKKVYCMHLLGYKMDEIIAHCQISIDEALQIIEKGPACSRTEIDSAN